MNIVLLYIQKYLYSPSRCLLSTYGEPGIGLNSGDSGILVYLMLTGALLCVRPCAFSHVISVLKEEKRNLKEFK